MLRYVMAILVFAAACGDEDDKGYSGACEEAVKPEIQAQMAQAQIDNMAARDAAVGAEQTRLGVVQFRPTTILGTAYSHGPYKPKVDPYPKSVVVSGDLSWDIRADGYQLNHGQMEQLNIYETEPGSEEYFLVDMVDGDGIGGNGRDANSVDVSYGFMEAPLEAPVGLEGYSYHSWHIAADNVLIRAKQKPQDTILGEVAICGCGPLYEVDSDNSSAKDSASEALSEYSIAVFMLTGKGKPKISEDTFEATFKRSFLQQNYVPRKGYHCRYRNSNTVC